MERTVKKLFLAGAVLLGGAASFMSLTSYAVSAEGSGAAAGVKSTTTFNLSVPNVLTLSNVTSDIALTASPVNIVTGTLSATVQSNAKYTISMRSNQPDLTSESGDTIPATNNVTAGTSGWGIQASGQAGYKAIDIEDQVFFSSPAAAPAATMTNFVVGVATSSALPTGMYRTSVTVTAAVAQ